MSFTIRRQKFQARPLDVFLTKPEVIHTLMPHIYNHMKAIGSQYFVDSSAHDGKVSEVLCPLGINCINYDLMPATDKVIAMDWFDLPNLPNEKTTVGFNPPFGEQGRLAIKFIRHAAFLNAALICMIVPTCILEQLRKEYQVVHVTSLNSNDFSPKVKIACSFCIIDRVSQTIKANVSTYHLSPSLNILPVKNASSIPRQGDILCMYRLRKGGPRNGYFRFDNVWYEYRHGKITCIGNEPQNRWMTSRAYYYTELLCVDLESVKRVCKKLNDYFSGDLLASKATLLSALSSE